jgi:hypothetical protein
MTARGALIKPWIFRELSGEHWDITIDERLAIYRRYVALGIEHWRAPRTADGEPNTGGIDDFGRQRLREFLRWHVGFWVRYAPQRPDGTWPSMQQRESTFVPRSPLEALFARADDPALDYITDQLIDDGDFSSPPETGVETAEFSTVEAG